MRKIAPILLWLTLLMGAAACSDGNRVATLPLLGSDATILAFGDSLTHGSGADTAQAYPAVLAQLTRRAVVVEATPGDQTSAGLSKLPAALEQHRPDLLLLCLGGNDFLRRQPLAQTRANLEAMIELARQRDVPVLLIGVPEPKLIGLKSHPLYAELAKQYDLPLENAVLAEILSDGDTKSDNIHPNAAGYREMAVAIAELLRASGAI